MEDLFEQPEMAEAADGGSCAAQVVSYPHNHHDYYNYCNHHYHCNHHHHHLYHNHSPLKDLCEKPEVAEAADGGSCAASVVSYHHNYYHW